MKLAEALIIRADLQKRIEQLKQRLVQNAKVQEGDEPAEEPDALLAELERASEELTMYIQRINRTNVTTAFSTIGTLADALAIRDVLKLKIEAYRELAQAAVITQGRYSKSEIKFHSTVSVSAIQAESDRLARMLRELDAEIQAANWLTELI